jgi:hypothetical protein
LLLQPAWLIILFNGSSQSLAVELIYCWQAWIQLIHSSDVIYIKTGQPFSCPGTP